MRKYILYLTLFSAIGGLVSPRNLFSQWYKQTIPVSKPIVGIEFTDSLRGWACTSYGTQQDRSYVLRTTNGGNNWVVNYDSAQYNFYAMDVVNDSTVYIVGSSLVNVNGLLIKTTNRGVNWTNMDINVGLIIEDVVFTSKDTGYICSSNSFAPGLWFTSNGGVSWQTRTGGMTATDIKSLYFLNNSTGWSGTLTYILYKTTNAGLNWVNNGNLNEGIFSIFFFNGNIGWLGLNSGKVANTTNGGINWSVQALQPYVFIINDIYFADLSRGWGGIGWLNVYKTENGGLNWGTQVDSCGGIRFSFLDSSRAWSCGFGIAKTTNSGGPITYVGIIKNHNEVPRIFTLYQNYPNPFNSQTIIPFELKRSGFVKLKIFDILGREKTIWASGKLLNAGTHELSFDATDFSSGVYFYQVTVTDSNGNTVFKESRKMILIK